MPRKSAAKAAKPGNRGKSAKPAEPVKPVKKTTAIREKMRKAAIISHIASEAGLTHNQVDAVLEELTVLMQRHLKKRSVGEFTLPGLLKIRNVKQPATKRRMGRNPRTGEQVEIAAKPAYTRVRLKALKALRDMPLS